MDDAFVRYLEVARAAYHEAIEQFPSVTKGEGTIRLSPSKPVIIREVTEEIEQSMELHTLTQKVSEEFDPRYSGKIDYCRRELSTFFRRSGCYIDLFERTSKADSEYLHLLRKQLEAEEVSTIWLALIDGAEFALDVLEFKDFSIRKFSSIELDNFFERRVAEIFYPKELIEDSDKYSQYWYLFKQGKTNKVGPRIIYFPPTYKTFEDELRAVCMYPIEGYFSLSWFARKVDSLLTKWRFTKSGKGDLYPLETVLVPEDHEMREYYEYEKRYTPYCLNDIQTEKFKKFVPSYYDSISHTKEKDGKFIQSAVNAFMKAFFKMWPHGLSADKDVGEDVLVHLVTAIEALIGEKGDGLTDKLARRSAILLGKDEKDTLKKWEDMKKFYRWRCDIVHGNVREVPPEGVEYTLETLLPWVREATIRMTSLLAEINTEEGKRKAQEFGIPIGLKPRQTCLRLIDHSLFNTEAREMVRESGKDLMEN